MLRLAVMAGLVLLAALFLALAGAQGHQSGGQPVTILPAPFAGLVFAHDRQMADFREIGAAAINLRASSRPLVGSGVFPDPFMQIISVEPGDFGKLG